MIEIMISIAVLALLIAIAIPPLGKLLSRNQARAAAKLFMDDLRQARYESRTRSNSIVTFCAIGSADKDDAINCDTSQGFKHGWQWFSDATLLGKTNSVSDTRVSITPLIKFRAEYVKGEVTIWNKDDPSTRSEIPVPYYVSDVAAYPSVLFTDTSGRTSEVVFDESGRTAISRR